MGVLASSLMSVLLAIDGLSLPFGCLNQLIRKALKLLVKFVIRCMFFSHGCIGCYLGCELLAFVSRVCFVRG